MPRPILTFSYVYKRYSYIAAQHTGDVPRPLFYYTGHGHRGDVGQTGSNFKGVRQILF